MGQLDTMVNMMILPFLKSAAVILAKRAIVDLMNSATFAEFSCGDQWTDMFEPLSYAIKRRER